MDSTWCYCDKGQVFYVITYLVPEGEDRGAAR